MTAHQFTASQAAADRIECLGKSLIQHGTLNRRIYLMKLHPDDLPELISALDHLARQRRYEKILAKVPAPYAGIFRRRGFAAEAYIPGFFKKRHAVVFMAKFLDDRRRIECHSERLLRHFKAVNRAASASRTALESGFDLHECGVADADEMSRLYRRVFESYPFPIGDADYLTAAMGDNHRFFSIRKDGAIVALANCEMDPINGNVEMTDFAVAPEWRRRRLAAVLLQQMESTMAAAGMHITYSISRSLSVGINMTFKHCGYRFAGKLTNNTHIAGQIESMWVWYKRLSDLG